MKSIDKLIASAQSADPEAIFEALCRVHDQVGPTDGPDNALERFAREMSRDGSVDADDDFPDFSDFSDESGDLVEQRAVSTTVVPDGDRDAVVESLLKTLASYRSLLERYSREFDAAYQRRPAGVEDGGDETVRRLVDAQALLVKYPLAAQAAFAALVREGRRFAATDAGQQWKRRLAGSPLLAKAKTLFEGLSSGMLSEHGDALPSVFIDEFLRALERNVEDVLAELGGV